MTPREVVGVALVRRRGSHLELLGARRTAPPELAGRWELPGGKVEAGESREQAAHREIREELGIAIELGTEVPSPDGDGWPVSAGLSMTVFLARVADGQIPAAVLQHDELRWIPFDRWDEVPWLDGDVAPVRAAVEVARRVGT